MVLASQFQVSDEEIRDYVRNVAWQNSSIHKFPSLLNPGEVLPKGYRRPSDTAIFKARRGTFKKVKIVPKLIGGGIRAGGLDRTTSIPTRLGKRHASADDDEISVNVFLPFTGDILKMSVSQNLSISGPSTPRNITVGGSFLGRNDPVTRNREKHTQSLEYGKRLVHGVVGGTSVQRCLSEGVSVTRCPQGRSQPPRENGELLAVPVHVLYGDCLGTAVPQAADLWGP